ncbi:MAG: hypothetical protein IT562_21430 [Alphaproteobacteria bacterium]|nr:hypothetical protein [Alphaproteobacteria bacterium]
MKSIAHPISRRFLLRAAAAAAAGHRFGAAHAETKIFPEITFISQPKLTLDVQRVEVARDYVPPGTKPNVEHLFPVTPSDAVARWAGDRLAAAGRGRLLRVVVKDASVVEVPLEKTGGIKGWFTTDQSERYDATLEVVVEVRSDVGREAFATARVKRSQTIEEGASPDKRREVWYAMTEKLMADLDKELERSMRQYLAVYLR